MDERQLEGLKHAIRSIRSRECKLPRSIVQSGCFGSYTPKVENLLLTSIQEHWESICDSAVRIGEEKIKEGVEDLRATAEKYDRWLNNE